ncbi:GDSL-type esterase/lipase family protein [Dermatophilus congolensis]|uniref:GDSL-type esterase/lipase family protein n=1 Tax=Dermatophilus congolensis TaxID=1863 RepID=UPI001AAF2F05|nr:SGNH/GDSL hydrolase family protein [Dermatophilus congolensis]MBO3131571.1 SGNH/GDSL hydrolase family protein [Dermatophilus congolensis]MBO3134276.1 SGNH/GDSL hydrolase family protein [Dermatophilus congolensis]MBO3136509.1 SGNH/GDSL hydrolase family protein [Dermatophilus congolensis]MBO3138754.1 SGNH/GDSL hydrolase family protein [Dermatophilus congolensis]
MLSRRSGSLRPFRLHHPGRLCAISVALVILGSSASASVASASGPVSVITFGDSVPSGAACHCIPFGEKVANSIASTQDKDYAFRNYARGGSTSAGLLSTLKTPEVRTNTAGSDLVLVETGANDFSPSKAAQCRNDIASKNCYGPQLRALRSNLSSALRTIKSLQKYPRAEVMALGYWNVFQDGAVGRAKGKAFVVGSDRLTREVNKTIRFAARDAGVWYVDVYTPFKGPKGINDPTSLLAADGDHPNGDGHQAIADAVIRRLGPRTSLV